MTTLRPGTRPFAAALLAWLAGLVFSATAIAADTDAARVGGRKTVLVLYGEARIFPAVIRIDEALRSRLDRITPPVELFTEHLDLSWASGQDYEAQLALFLREKYAVGVANAEVFVYPKKGSGPRRVP